MTLTTSSNSKNSVRLHGNELQADTNKNTPAKQSALNVSDGLFQSTSIAMHRNTKSISRQTNGAVNHAIEQELTVHFQRHSASVCNPNNVVNDMPPELINVISEAVLSHVAFSYSSTQTTTRAATALSQPRLTPALEHRRHNVESNEQQLHNIIFALANLFEGMPPHSDASNAFSARKVRRAEAVRATTVKATAIFLTNVVVKASQQESRLANLSDNVLNANTKNPFNELNTDGQNTESVFHQALLAQLEQLVQSILDSAHAKRSANVDNKQDNNTQQNALPQDSVVSQALKDKQVKHLQKLMGDQSNHTRHEVLLNSQT